MRRIARLDLVERRGEYWCDAELHDCASTFDGDLWLATRGSEVFAVDTTASRWRAVWGVEVEPRGARCSVRRDGHWFVVSVHVGEELEHWHYEGFTLRARKPWTRIGTEYVVVPPKPTELPFTVRDPEDATVSDVATISSVKLGADLAIVSRRTDAGSAITCTHLKAHRTLASLRLEGAAVANMRLTDKLLTIGDDRGRVIVLDVERGVVRRDLRTN
jgi:hypothetical protein